jgi:hypothetical protein
VGGCSRGSPGGLRLKTKLILPAKRHPDQGKRLLVGLDGTSQAVRRAASGWAELWAGAARGRGSGASKLAATRAVSGPARNGPMLAPLFEARPLVAA